MMLQHWMTAHLGFALNWVGKALTRRVKHSGLVMQGAVVQSTSAGDKVCEILAMHCEILASTVKSNIKPEIEKDKITDKHKHHKH